MSLLWRIASVAGRRAGGHSSLGDESSLGEKAAFLFLGLAVDGDLDGHLGCVLGNAVSKIQGIVPIPLQHTW